MSSSTSFDLANMPQSSPKKVTTPKKNIATRKSCKVSLNFRDKGVKVWVPKESSANLNSLAIESFENVKLEVIHQPDISKQRNEEVEGNKENQQHISSSSLSFSFSKYKDSWQKDSSRSRHSSTSSNESQLKKKKKRNSTGQHQIKRVKTNELISEENLGFQEEDFSPKEFSSQEDELILHFPISDFHTLKWESLSIELIPGKLYFSDIDLTTFAYSNSDAEFISLSSEDLRNNTWRTTSYFGPLSFCQIMLWKDNFLRLVDSQTRVCFFLEKPLESLMEPEDNHQKNEILANAVLLMSSCMMLFLNKSIDEALLPFMQKYVNMYSFVPVDGNVIGITVRDCLEGLQKSLEHELFCPDAFDLYGTIDLQRQLDLTWILEGKLAACCSPNYSSFYIHPPSLDNYVNYFKSNNILGIVRLNDQLYPKTHFIENGIDHLDIPFMDGQQPSSDTVRHFISYVESIHKKGGAVVIHCRGGIGRTGTLLACFLMREYKLTANETIAYLRLRRPGCVGFLQHQYLLSIEHELWQMKESNAILPSSDTSMSPAMKAELKSVLQVLQMDIDLSELDAIVSFTRKQFRKFYFHCVSSRFANPLPFSLPKNSPHIEVLEYEVRMTVEDLLRLAENLLLCGRMEVSDSLEEYRDGKPFFH